MNINLRYILNNKEILYSMLNLLNPLLYIIKNFKYWRFINIYYALVKLSYDTATLTTHISNNLLKNPSKQKRQKYIMEMSTTKEENVLECSTKKM